MKPTPPRLRVQRRLVQMVGFHALGPGRRWPGPACAGCCRRPHRVRVQHGVGLGRTVAGDHLERRARLDLAVDGVEEVEQAWSPSCARRLCGSRAGPVHRRQGVGRGAAWSRPEPRRGPRQCAGYGRKRTGARSRPVEHHAKARPPVAQSHGAEEPKPACVSFRVCSCRLVSGVLWVCLGLDTLGSRYERPEVRPRVASCVGVGAHQGDGLRRAYQISTNPRSPHPPRASLHRRCG